MPGIRGIRGIRWRPGLGAAEAEFQALALVTATAAVLATPEVEIQFLHLKNKESLKKQSKKNAKRFNKTKSDQDISRSKNAKYNSGRVELVTVSRVSKSG